MATIRDWDDNLLARPNLVEMIATEEGWTASDWTRWRAIGRRLSGLDLPELVEVELFLIPRSPSAEAIQGIAFHPGAANVESVSQSDERPILDAAARLSFRVTDSV